MWTKDISKLELAANMIRQVMSEFKEIHRVLLLFDSWYAKSDLIKIVNEYENLDIICRARSNSVLYDLLPEKTRHRGRPAKKGKRLSICDDFELSNEKTGSYYIGIRRVLKNILEKELFMLM